MERLRFRVVNPQIPSDTWWVSIDPFCVAAVEDGLYSDGKLIAKIRMVDGHEYKVQDPEMKVAVDIWLGKSYST